MGNFIPTNDVSLVIIACLLIYFISDEIFDLLRKTAFDMSYFDYVIWILFTISLTLYFVIPRHWTI